MSVSNPDVIDFISTETKTSDVILTISDHLDWSDVQSHLVALQDKINAYLTFILNGELKKKHPVREGQRLVIQVSGKFATPKETEGFFDRVNEALKEFGVAFRWMWFYSEPD